MMVPSVAKVLLQILALPVLHHVSALTPHSKVHFSRLTADTFRHSLDLTNTRAIQSSFVGNLEGTLRRALPQAEQVIFLENMATSVKVSETQLPALHESLVEAVNILGISRIPDLFVKQNPAPNAYTLAVNGDKPFIVVHSSLLEICSPEEQQAVLAHELGHLKCEHGVWLSLGNLVSIGASTVPLVGRALDVASRQLLLEWQRSAEFSCDRAALLVAQDSKVVVNALLKLIGGGTSSGRQALNAEAFLEQAAAYSAALESSPRSVRMAQRAASSGASHPLPALRVAELDRWSKGPEFHGLLARGRRPD